MLCDPVWFALLPLATLLRPTLEANHPPDGAVTRAAPMAHSEQGGRAMPKASPTAESAVQGLGDGE